MKNLIYTLKKIIPTVHLIKKSKILLLASILISSFTISAQDYYFYGYTDTVWTTVSNWDSFNGYPGTTIPAGEYARIPSNFSLGRCSLDVDVTNNGRMLLQSKFYLNGHSLTNNGTLEFTGTVWGTITNSASGNMSPGWETFFPTDNVNLNGGNLINDGLMNMDFRGSDNSFDYFYGVATADLDGELEIRFRDNFTPVVNQNYKIIDATTIVGTFANVTWPSGWAGTITYTGGDVNVMFLSGPELDIRNEADDSDITDGSTTISIVLGTDFGGVEALGTNSVSKTFRAENNGGADLTFDATALELSNTTDFSITTGLSGTIAASGVQSFTIKFDPQSVGTKNCTVTINSDDADEDPYTFEIQGEGLDFTNAFETKWIATDVTIPTNPAFTYNYDIDWGDGTIKTDQTGNASHTFASVGPHTVKIIGTFPAIYINDGSEKSKIQSVDKWGTIVWESFENAFYGCSNLNINAPDNPNLSTVSNMSYAFRGCASMNENISTWDVSNVTNMNWMFALTDLFNQNIGSWDVSSVTDMSFMFYYADAFNQSIGGWNVSSVTDMSYMFSNAIAFNQNIGGWVVSDVTNMELMFIGANAFNQDIGGWDVSSVTNMKLMFTDADAFNQDISGWDVSGVTIFEEMFGGADAFNQNIGGWDVSSANYMSQMFSNADAFNQNIGGWDVSGVTNFEEMFKDADAFNQDIGGWDVSSAADMSQMFSGASAFNQDISGWDVTSVDMYGMFEMFDNCAIDIDNYDKILNGWSTKSLQSNINLGANGLEYCNGETGRNDLINNHGWTIYGDSKICPELDIRNNADDLDIPNGFTTINSFYGTDFGGVSANGGTSSNTFRAENNGSADLTFGTDALSISNTTDFSITTDLTNNGTVAMGGVETFTIQFNPITGGTKTCTVTIRSDDADEDPYTFEIQGVGCLSGVSNIFVDIDATGNNDGTSWANAFAHLQDAIDASCGSNTEIWVADGTYFPTRYPDPANSTNPRDKAFYIASDVEIYGGFNGTETMRSQSNPTTNITVLNGDFNNDDIVSGTGSSLSISNNIENAYHVLVVLGGSNSIVSGLTFKGGNANGSGNITSFIFRSSGGGITIDSKTKIERCIFTENSGSSGGGIYNNTVDPTISDCIFRNNYSYNSGGGMFNRAWTNNVINSEFYGNRSYNGGAYANSYSDEELINCTFAQNYAANNGGALYHYGSNPNLRNCIIWGNTATGSGQNVSNGRGFTSNPNFSFCDIEGSGGSSSWVSSFGVNGGGNLDIDPEFTDPITNDFSLFICSPAKDNGNDSYNTTNLDLAGNNRKFNTIDMGAYEIQSLPPEIDIKGNGEPIPQYSSPSVINDTDFGGHGLGVTHTHTFTIENSGNGNLDLGTIIIDNSVDFSVTQPLVNQIIANSSTTFTITFNSVALGKATAAVTIPNNDCDEPSYSFNVSGEACNNLSLNNFFVDIDATGNNDGTSWTHAYTDLQDAIDATCGSLTEIWVADGTYLPTDFPYPWASGSRAKSFYFTRDIQLYGGFNGTETLLIQRDPATNITILSGDFNGDDIVTGSGSSLSFSNNGENAFNVLSLDGYTNFPLSANTIIDGFTIKGGTSNDGAGVSINNASPTINNCKIVENSTTHNGGGMSIDFSSSIISNCTFSSNKAVDGGALYVDNSNITINDCSFSDNYSSQDFFGIGGGGVIARYSFISLTNCEITKNSGKNGGGLFLEQSFFTLLNCTVSDNFASENAGGIGFSNFFSPAKKGTKSASAMSSNVSSITNSIIWGNTASSNPNLEPYHSSLSIDHTNLEGSGGSGSSWVSSFGIDGGSNIDKNPFFIDVPNDDFGLNECSPSKNTGDDNANTSLLDLAGNPRKFNTIDMGSLESQISDGIVVKGNGQLIANGNSTPSIANDTDFEAPGINTPHTHMFTIENSGTVSLTIGTIIIDNLTDFSITQPTTTSISVGGSVTFTVTFNTATFGHKNAIVTIPNNICDPYTFNVTGEGCYAGITNLFVDKDATGNNDGTSWTNAFTGIQDALEATCGSITEIWVADGTYLPTKSPDPGYSSQRYRAFHFSQDLQVYGGFNGSETMRSQRDPLTNVTILSGDFSGNDVVSGSGSTLSFSNNGENAYHVLVTADLTPTSIIDGFTIKAGYASFYSGPRKQIEGKGGGGYITYAGYSYGDNCGAGVYNISSSPIISNCIITENVADEGSGIYNYGTGCNVNFNECTITKNGQNGEGGGGLNKKCSPSYTDCIISENKADQGGGMMNFDVSVTFLRCKLLENHTTYAGGGMYNTYSILSIKNCLIAKNEALTIGGGIYAQNGFPELQNTSIVDNDASYRGGGIYADNEDWDGVPPIQTTSSSFYNNIIWGNTGSSYPNIYNDFHIQIMNYSNIEGSGGSGALWDTQIGQDGGNNIDTDPLFTDPNNGDYLIKICSPSKETGDNNNASGTLDLNGNSRLVGTVDMGAYENQTINGGTTLPEIDITGMGQSISNGDTSPDVLDDTDFGNHASGVIHSHDFTIKNNGCVDLTIGTIAVSPSVHFSVSQPSTTTIASEGNTTFSVTFTSPLTGIHEAIITIPNNDNDEDPYTFKAKGTGPLPTISINATNSTISENGSSNLVYQFTRDITIGALDVNFTISGTASDSDFTVSGATSYSNRTGVITFADGAATVDLLIAPVDDGMIEANETVIVKIGNP